MRAYIDSDILIWHLRGEKKALKFFKKIKEEYSLFTGAMQRAEVTFFMRENEKEETLLFLSQFETTSVSQEIVDKASSLYRKWNPSNGIDPNDAILAATAQITGGKIFTLNTKHFPMKDIVVSKAW